MLAPSASVSASSVSNMSDRKWEELRPPRRFKHKHWPIGSELLCSDWPLRSDELWQRKHRKKNHKWRRNNRTNFIYKHDVARGRGCGGAWEPSLLVKRASSRALNKFQYLWVATFHRETNWTKWWEFQRRQREVKGQSGSGLKLRDSSLRSSQSLLWFYYRAL